MGDRKCRCSTFSYYKMPTSVRLDSETQQKLDRLARRSGLSKSAVIRRAIFELARQEAESVPEGGVFARVQHLAGIGAGGDPSRSQNMGTKLGEMLRKRREEA